MKFSAREDIEAPIQQVYARVTDFAGYERQMLRRGADVKRLDTGQPVVVGSAWDATFTYRGRERRVQARIARLDAPTDLVVSIVANGLDGATTVELVALSPKRTRLSVTIELSARSIPARLLLQSLKLAKSNLTARFKKRVSEFAKSVEGPATGNP
ncbi:Polyketide cyclase / dehydrase and lipid transport [Loktanella fryxellensis]|uniref:Polyketide cyclase / dehydrase and lipid transport n=1 Tax=Loktanella fryxellensis TaxID=245187 RepID=A0A1H8AYK2_9RHOB|nr:SRPBCC family protein [Loktanella fryxellensis]SEM74858.1 Polyketide cyclase / dehydrase and lipid transport [Loktanella fryxellensis]